VGRLNPAKLANFSEIEGWVVVGCWEGGLIGEDQESGYWKPVITPFEMEVALMKEEERIWGGEWWGGIERLKLDEPEATNGVVNGESQAEDSETKETNGASIEVDQGIEEDGVEGEESMPPEFDLRTGRLVSHSRPMRLAVHSAKANKTSEGGSSSAALIKRAAPGELASINGVASPGAEYLRSQRTWQGLGSDFAENQEASTVIEEGLSGIARGYRVGEEVGRH
jgi:diphthamide biosynthesis protein 2